jgi:hypothetical protein
VSVSGLHLTADRTEGRRRRVSTVVVERDHTAVLEGAATDSSTESE